MYGNEKGWQQKKGLNRSGLLLRHLPHQRHSFRIWNKSIIFLIPTLSLNLIKLITVHNGRCAHDVLFAATESTDGVDAAVITQTSADMNTFPPSKISPLIHSCTLLLQNSTSPTTVQRAPIRQMSWAVLLHNTESSECYNRPHMHRLQLTFILAPAKPVEAL